MSGVVKGIPQKNLTNKGGCNATFVIRRSIITLRGEFYCRINKATRVVVFCLQVLTFRTEKKKIEFKL